MITLITGATSGIGEQLAIKYAQLGDTVIACGRNSDKLTCLDIVEIGRASCRERV